MCYFKNCPPTQVILKNTKSETHWSRCVSCSSQGLLSYLRSCHISKYQNLGAIYLKCITLFPWQHLMLCCCLNRTVYYPVILSHVLNIRHFWVCLVNTESCLVSLISRLLQPMYLTGCTLYLWCMTCSCPLSIDIAINSMCSPLQKIKFLHAYPNFERCL